MSRQMTIAMDYPPNFADLIAAGFEPGKGAIFTYGDVIYNPDQVEIDGALLAHETRHAEQQAEMGIPEWWERWKLDPAFRAEQEAQGYGRQYHYACAVHKDRNARARYLWIIAGHLTSGMYKLTMSRSDATAAIIKRSK
jgi:hypothetical protein